jgi:hypothetical protein
MKFFLYDLKPNGAQMLAAGVWLGLGVGRFGSDTQYLVMLFGALFIYLGVLVKRWVLG